MSFTDQKTNNQTLITTVAALTRACKALLELIGPDVVLTRAIRMEIFSITAAIQTAVKTHPSMADEVHLTTLAQLCATKAGPGGSRDVENTMLATWLAAARSSPSCILGRNLPLKVVHAARIEHEKKGGTGLSPLEEKARANAAASIQHSDFRRYPRLAR